MPQVRLIYFSRAQPDLSLADIQQILTSARQRNHEKSICGMLCFESACFLQVLEGERAAVNQLYLDIADDPRHYDIQILNYQEIGQPVFQRWSMGFAPTADQFYPLLNQLGHNRFEPSQMTSEQALSFALGLADSMPDD